MNDDNRTAAANMSFTLKAMAALKTSRSIFFEEGGFALATGTDAASENWAFFSSCRVDAKKIQSVCSFFDELGLPFVWPVFPDGAADKNFLRMLQETGMSLRGELQVMIRKNLSENLFMKRDRAAYSLTFETDLSDPCVWAETAWRAFDSSDGAPASFLNLAPGLSENKNFSLILAKKDGVPAGTAMLTVSGESAGIYYFATMPEERKKGVGDAMMREAVRIALQRGCRAVTLQATPSGAPFYASRGFVPLFRLPLYSFSEDVF